MRSLIANERNYELSIKKMMIYLDEVIDGYDDIILYFEYDHCYTVGKSGNVSSFLQNSPIPVFISDRGGEITYHGPGQLIVYPIINIQKRGIYIHEYIKLLQNIIVDSMKDLNINARYDGPIGVWVDDKKIASIGLRVRKGVVYHGVSINVSCDLSWFDKIDVCGVHHEKTTSLYELGVQINMQEFIQIFEKKMKKFFHG